VLGHLLSPVLESISPLKNSCALFFYAHNSRAGFYSTDFFRIIRELDDLMLPYTIDLSLYQQLNHAVLKEHIQRVGIIFY